MKKGFLRPTIDQTFEIVAGDKGHANFKRTLHQSRELQSEGQIEEACNMRFDAVRTLQEVLGDDDDVLLEWSDENSRAAIELLRLSAIDHFLISDYEISSALLEMALDLDPEDHLEASNLLAYDYLALGEYELFDEVINDISDKHASRTILLLWSSYLRDGVLPAGEIHSLKARFTPYYDEFVATDHLVDDEYIASIESERPSQSAMARELWLQTESLWSENPLFIEALRNA